MHPSWELWKAEAAETINILKERYPDLVVHRVIEAVSDPSTGRLMTLRVEGKVCERLAPGRGAIYLPLKRIGVAIDEARRARRPEQTVYGTLEGSGVEAAPPAAPKVAQNPPAPVAVAMPPDAELELEPSEEVGANGSEEEGAEEQRPR